MAKPRPPKPHRSAPAPNNTPTGADTLVTVEYAAAALQLHPRTVHRFIHEGRLAAKKVGKSYRIRRSDLEALSGLPAAEAPAASLTSILDIPGVDAEAAKLWKRTMALALASRGSVAADTRAEFIHDEARGQLKLVIVGPPDHGIALLLQAQNWMRTSARWAARPAGPRPPCR